MNNLNSRIYEELNEWKYTQCILSASLLKEHKRRKYLNGILILISICSVVGWFKFNKLKFVWLFFLICTQAIRIFQNTILQSDTELFSIKSSIDFYEYNLMELENLFYDYHNSKFKDATIEKQLNKFRTEERNLFSRQNFEKIKDDIDLIQNAEKETDIYLSRLKNNLS